MCRLRQSCLSSICAGLGNRECPAGDVSLVGNERGARGIAEIGAGRDCRGDQQSRVPRNRRVMIEDLLGAGAHA